MTVYVLEILPEIGVVGVYSSQELAERAADKLLEKTKQINENHQFVSEFELNAEAEMEI